MAPEPAARSSPPDQELGGSVVAVALAGAFVQATRQRRCLGEPLPAFRGSMLRRRLPAAAAACAVRPAIPPGAPKPRRERLRRGAGAGEYAVRFSRKAARSHRSGFRPAPDEAAIENRHSLRASAG